MSRTMKICADAFSSLQPQRMCLRANGGLEGRRDASRHGTARASSAAPGVEPRRVRRPQDQMRQYGCAVQRAVGARAYKQLSSAPICGGDDRSLVGSGDCGSGGPVGPTPCARSVRVTSDHPRAVAGAMGCAPIAP